MSSFDKAAATYDADFTFTETGRLQRAKVRSELVKFLAVRKEILELNCGTGEDALWLAVMGHGVTATDISEGMIRKARAKAGDNPVFRAMGFSEVDQINKKFDIVFSNFGGLNCASPDELISLGSKLTSMTDRGSFLVFVVMGRKCIWERLYFFLKKDDRRNRRTSIKPVMADLGSGAFPVYYYSPAEFASYFKGYVTKKVSPVGLFVPPSYLERSFQRSALILKLFFFLDRIFDSSFFADHADHYLIVMKKENKQ